MMFKRKKKKRSFLEKLTGVVHLEDEGVDQDDLYEDNLYDNHSNNRIEEPNGNFNDSDDIEGELSVDVLNTDDSIVIKAMVAGVRPADIDIDISRDMVTVRATREDEHEVSEENFYQKELYWGSFSRNILLPEEIDVDAAEAKEKNGLLILTLPKVDKNRKTKLQVKS